MHFRTRIGAFIEDMLEHHRDQVVVAVCHGGVIELTFDHIFNIGPWRRCEVWCKNTGITRFEYVEHPRREMWRLHYHSRAEHLHGIESVSYTHLDVYKRQAYVFGSLAQPGRYQAGSDIDIAVVWHGRDFFDMAGEISHQLGQDIDILPLASLPFADKIVREGIRWIAAMRA